VSSPEEDAWRQIVAHYGDAPDFPDEPDADEPDSAEPDSAEPDSANPDRSESDSAGPGGPDRQVDVPDEEEPDPFDEDRFVPPEPPPIPRPQGSRLVAWLGVFGAPILLAVCAIANFRLSSFISTLLVVWFLGGFGYLVWQMPKDRDDPYDDGARL
jgi:hypothetical protein